MIRAQGLGRTFGRFVAVESLDLDVAEGEVFGLLGPNGAGKTTTVRLLTGVIEPTSGTATVAGHSVRHAPEKVRAQVGILTETPGLYVRLDAVENLRFFGELAELSGLERRIQEVLERLDLWHRRREPVGGWSKGMRQRLAIARAVLHAPKVLFLDEPTSGLDPEAARSVRGLVSELRAEGCTIVLCTHNLDEAERLCDRIGILKTRLLRTDTPARLRREFAEPRTVVRLGAPWPEDLEARIAAWPFVRSFASAADGGEGQTLRVALAAPDLDTPALVRALVEAGASVRSVADETPSLERVYLDLVGAPHDDAVGGGAS